jgi:hypothetical protein
MACILKEFPNTCGSTHGPPVIEISEEDRWCRSKARISNYLLTEESCHLFAAFPVAKPKVDTENVDRSQIRLEKGMEAAPRLP